MSAIPAILITIGLLFASGFFVAAEFAFVGARRHRLEQAASMGSKGAKAAIKSIRDVSFMLAGAQFGITMVMVGLGMVSEPAFHHLLEPVMSWLGLPSQAADVAALVIALGVVTYLHVVVGEMAPKSWAIAHPDRSAMLLARPFNVYARLAGWLLRGMNNLTNQLLRLVRVTPRDEIVTVHNREQLHHLVEESRRLNLIDEEESGLLTRTLDAPARPVTDVMVLAEEICWVSAEAAATEVIAEANRTGHTRFVVAAGSEVVGAIHVRAALIARHRADADWTAGAVATPVPRLSTDADLTVSADALREVSATIGLVVDPTGSVVGMVSMNDLVSKILVS